MPVRNRRDVVLPPATIGILGGGQLGRMIAIDGRKMGYRFEVLDPTPDCPTAQVADGQVQAEYRDLAAAKQLAERCDIVTYEFENVDADVAAVLEQSTAVPQGSSLLATTQHRVREKTALHQAGLPVTPFVPIYALADLDSAYRQFSGEMVVKTSRGGYDGKGQWMVRSAAQFNEGVAAWSDILLANAAASTRGDAGDAALIAEQYIPFIGECSVVVARNRRGEVAAFPASENVHVHHILHLSIVPARFDASVMREAERLARQVAEALDVIGLVAVEFFVTAGGELFINELAPRPHNSGHYTMDACATSQFEQHLRAICNLPLGDVSLLTPAVMVNVLGQHVEGVFDAMADFPSNVKVHWYGKAEAKRDRKMGHLTILTEDVEKAIAWIESTGIWG
ncbi:5-(carboxyamino)imidazole ribonucleotide synthase [Alicyclobacillus acidiphilus]|uniref:5-(carboxyamino)imidazole ribonucleotide synthase n=1 Tax=Alicyclobacillus acidiphilus TaxID=182455 RepID=UPI00083589D4|nr:5-(carboxyamino)imidazole ribonucleotide synthase [Alicyclobacillus acidiphilus]